MRLPNYSKSFKANPMKQRHQLVYLHKKSNFDLTCIYDNSALLYQVASEWINAGHPCVFTRQPPSLSALIHLGLTVLLHNKTYRVGILVEPSAIQRVADLPTIKDCAFLFPNAIPSFNESIYVYGSFMFQYLSSLPFTHACSDLDLLIDYQQENLQQLTKMTSMLSIATQRKIDGEVRFNNIGEISLWELIQLSSPQLLVKTTTNAFLINRQKLYEYYPSLLQ